MNILTRPVSGSGRVDGISVIHINLRGSRAATAQLVQHAASSQVELLLVQDPYVKKGTVTGFPLIWTVYPSTDMTCAAIVTDKALQSVLVFTTQNVVFVNIAGR